jgi:bacillithiol system protein YtxJ
VLKHCGGEKDYRTALRESGEGPVFFLKHSTTCGISSGARSEFQRFASEKGEIPCWEMVIQEDRELSTLIAGETGIAHESPQVLLFRNGKASWSASHWDINGESLKAALGAAE